MFLLLFFHSKYKLSMINYVTIITKKFNILLIKLFLFYNIYYSKTIYQGDWGLGIGDWGLGIGPNPQSPIPNPQYPIPI